MLEHTEHSLDVTLYAKRPSLCSDKMFYDAVVLLCPLIHMHDFACGHFGLLEVQCVDNIMYPCMMVSKRRSVCGLCLCLCVCVCVCVCGKVTI